MTEISPLRLNLLRIAYLIMAGGIAAVIWPTILNHRPDWPLMNSVVACMMAGMSLIAALGLRYPLQMLPILLFELAWKTIWLAAVALPLWSAGKIDPRTAQTVFETGLAVILLPLIPWDHVVRHYVAKAGSPWWRAAAN